MLGFSVFRDLSAIRKHRCSDEVRKITNQPNLTAIIQSRCLSIFEHIARTDDDADAKMVLTAPPTRQLEETTTRASLYHEAEQRPV